MTNRKVATKLNVSVRLAHALLGQLAHKGLLHIRKRHSRRWDYFLTPQGIAEKARLTYEFMDFTMQFYREARRRSADVLCRLHKEGVQKMAFWGVGELAEIAYLGLQEHKLVLVEVFDDAKAGQEFMGLPVQPASGLAASGAERILVTAFDPALPMGERFLPGAPEVAADARLVWIFGARGAAPIPAETPTGRSTP